MSDPIKLGMLAWNQYTTWPSMRDAAVRADQLGYDDLWTCDHCSIGRTANRWSLLV